MLRYLGTYQDGGVCYNNPSALALWETRAIWPDRGDADLALSLGTGVANSKTPSPKRGPFSPVTDRFIPRLLRALMVNMDGEKAWHEVSNTVSSQSKTRLHRLNVRLEGRYLSLDEVDYIPTLKERTLDECKANNQLEVVTNSLIASLFYFELDTLPDHSDSGVVCKGTIFCRLQLPRAGRKALLAYLKEHNAFFLINGRPLRAVDVIPRCAPPFRQKVSVQVSSADDTIGISLRHSSMSPNLISGLPKTVKALIDLQMLNAPFGRPDHEQSEKPLPQPPRKRGSSQDSPPTPKRWTLRSSMKRVKFG